MFAISSPDEFLYFLVSFYVCVITVALSCRHDMNDGNTAATAAAATSFDSGSRLT